MIKVRRIAHAVLETPEFERQIDHYERVIGLKAVHRGPNSAHLVTKIGQLALIF